LLGSAKNPQVYVIDNGIAMLREIHTGGSNGVEVEVIDGLKQGEQVVTNGQINLSNGSKVEVAK
jgi:multidrug efflux pump subunit AcrA (membrane-fusion protein)